MEASPWPKGKKLVHLDLKGAPPRIEYLHKLIELFASLGADGLLLEYEDMFPYEGELKMLQATSHPPYSREEILSIQDVARSQGLTLSPLHLSLLSLSPPTCLPPQFVLKHRSLCGLREVDRCLGTLNPHLEEGRRLVEEMLRQVVDLHPGLSSIHIGADEVYLLGEGAESQRWLGGAPGRSVQQLFLGHVTRVARGVREAWPHLNIIMWDDMLRGMDQETLRDSGLGGLVQPMLWDYSPALDVEATVSLLEKYQASGLAHLWAASSFKGSTCVHTCVPSTLRHVQNHLQWLKVAGSSPAGAHLQGIALTGWQRYDHMSVLCELLPVGLPSLASCLQTLHHGRFCPEAQARATHSLGTHSVEAEAMAGSPGSEAPSFPGSRLAELVVELTALLGSEELRHFENNMYVRGWLSPYHRQRRMVNPLITQQIQDQATALQAVVMEKVEAVREEMVRLYPASTAQEWVEQHVEPVMAPLQRVLEATRVCLVEMLPHNPSPSLGDRQ